MNLTTFLRTLSRLEREYDDETDERTIRERVITWAEARLYRADVVTELPAEAPAGKFMVTGGDTNLYIGAGAGRPLRKIPTQAL